ncbi:hypothetical protein ABZY05_25885 [Streptomyces canus]|nr:MULTISPECIES: hypothetical protein [Streptomyces]MDI5907872.1 hypothetical protein [Streptomyces sp. 12257]
MNWRVTGARVPVHRRRAVLLAAGVLVVSAGVTVPDSLPCAV